MELDFYREKGYSFPFAPILALFQVIIFNDSTITQTQERISQMKKNNIAVILILAVSAVLFTLGVIKKISHTNANRNKMRYTLAVIPKGTASMWWEVVRKGAEAAAKEEGYEINWTGPEQENDREKQIQVVEDAVSQRVSAIVLGPNDAFALVRPVKEAREAGIPIIIIDSSLNSSDFESFAATDNYAGGADAARRLGTAMNKWKRSARRPASRTKAM